MPKLKVNRLKCKKCGDVIESTWVHDFKYCKCGAIFVDGGLEYSRYGWPSGSTPESAIENLQEWEDAP
ncbi:MAG: hypothetical protein KGL39_08830 [Patescibacteria group bacterium]|nr:hypothetical protein [Patescibacteria group bacterium]